MREVLFYYYLFSCKTIILVTDSRNPITNKTSPRLRALKIDKLTPYLMHLLREKTVLRSNTTACNGHHVTEIELKMPQFNIFVACCSVSAALDTLEISKFVVKFTVHFGSP